MLCLKIFSITCVVQNCWLPLMGMINRGFYRKFAICNNTCKNNGKCILENGQVKCKCSLPYVGSFCEHTRNPCQFSKCLNGGTCAPNEDFTDYTCLCQKDFKGLLCEKGIGECSKNLQKKCMDSNNASFL